MSVLGTIIFDKLTCCINQRGINSKGRIENSFPEACDIEGMFTPFYPLPLQLL